MKKFRIISAVLYIDALLSIGFGIFSLLSVDKTFATIIQIGNPAPPVIVAILNSASISYILIGAVCIIAARSSFPINIQLTVVMIFRHAWVGIVGYLDAGKDWIIENPIPDIVIHSVLVLLYLSAIFIEIRRRLNRGGLGKLNS